MSFVGLIPVEWCDSVIRILKRGDPRECCWTFRARQDWQQFGMSTDAYALLINILKKREVWGERIYGMNPQSGNAKVDLQVTYAFLCDHPFNPQEQLYAKIGLYSGRLKLDIFSLHHDLTGALKQKISEKKKKLKSTRKKEIE